MISNDSKILVNEPLFFTYTGYLGGRRKHYKKFVPKNQYTASRIKRPRVIPTVLERGEKLKKIIIHLQTSILEQV